MVWGQMNELNSEPAEHENGNSERDELTHVMQCNDGIFGDVRWSR
jgi:hypothetical protein